MKNKKGFILLLTLIFVTILTVFTGSLIYMTTADMRNVASQSDDINLAGLADAGIEKAYREISNDYSGSAPSPGSAIGVAGLRGADTLSSVNPPGDIANMRYINETPTILFATISAANQQLILKTFDTNYTNTRIISVVLWSRAIRAGGGTGNNQLIVDYTVDGGLNYTAAFTSGNLGTNWAQGYSSHDITADRTWDWPTLMDPVKFRVRARRTGSGSRTVNLDALWLTVTYSIDTLKERWATGGYATFPIPLSGGTVQSITITDEASKINLNYASKALMSRLFTNIGVSSPDATAQAIIDYLALKPGHHFFDSLEELQQVPGIASQDCDIILDRNHTKGYITVSVYSYINQNAYSSLHTGAPVSRPPVNINTARFEVLEAIFYPLNLVSNSGNPATLANAIITFRGSTPFTCFYSSNAAVTTDFVDFVNSQTSYLTLAERDTVIDNADASLLLPRSGGGTNAVQTTEFCYAGNVFYISGNDTDPDPVVNNSGLVAKLGGRKFYVKTLRGNGYDSLRTRVFATYSGDTTFSGWRKESFKPLQ